MSRSFSRIADGVYLTRSATYLTSSVVLVADGKALLVDPAWEPAELTSIADFLATTGLNVVAGFSTHAHHDHLLWHPRFGDAPRWASAPVTELASEHRDDLIGALGPQWPPEFAALVGQVEPVVGNTLDWSGFQVELIVHDAHSRGHAALWLPQQQVLLAGDMLSDVELPLPQETGIRAYLDGLDTLAPYVSQATVLVPGHGHPASENLKPGSVAARLQDDRDYVRQLIRTGTVEDRRLAMPDMEQTHEQNLILAQQYRTRSD